ncbi:hypothetical protein [Paraflavitalea speifideaquila]|uniref:hypothetical protein n=1 Tax=Paraflavitalea speifideaquila TaxID=3076558 RepID=UPI0028EAC5BD|nr:hypothetical protein [Paraflavitalea speifideiaquila]
MFQLIMQIVRAGHQPTVPPLKHARNEKNVLTKGVTLLGFVLLISAFLLYRAQVIDPFPTNARLIAGNSLPADTTKLPALDSLKRPSPEGKRQLLMSSSKSIVVMKEDRRLLDSVFPKRKTGSSVLPTTTMMSSSKSSQIFSPAALQRLIDSMRIDSAVKKTHYASVSISLK